MSKENKTTTETTGYGEGTLTEEELLILDTLLYYEELSGTGYQYIGNFVDACQNKGYTSVTNNVLADEYSGLSGVVEYVANNEKLRDLEIVYSSSQSGLASSNAVCLRDSENNLYVLYSGNYGPGDYDEDSNDNTSQSTWQDNFMGGSAPSTREQEEAKKFFEDAVNLYGADANHIIVSGHSKGGNLAQIVTILCGEDVTACLSIDGQGVSSAFMEEHSAEIVAYGSKIKSIMPTRSYVGTLLNQIETAECVYIDSELRFSANTVADAVPLAVMGGLIANIAYSHFSTTLLNENWEFREEGDQKKISKIIHNLSVELTDYASEDRYFSEEDQRVVNHAMENIGIIVFELLSTDTNWDRINSVMWDADTVTYMVRSIFGIFPQEVEETLTGIYYEMINTMGNYIENLVIGWESICDWFGDRWADLFGDATNARVRIDPLILDVDGDGFNIESKKYGAYFDLNCDGFAERINWTNRDAILAVDRNGNGMIDDGREVFGDYHLLADGSRAANGFEALAQYDTNVQRIYRKMEEIRRCR